MKISLAPSVRRRVRSRQPHLRSEPPLRDRRKLSASVPGVRWLGVPMMNLRRNPNGYSEEIKRREETVDAACCACDDNRQAQRRRIAEFTRYHNLSPR